LLSIEAFSRAGTEKRARPCPMREPQIGGTGGISAIAKRL